MVAEFVLFVVLATVSVPAPVAASAGIGKTNHETAHIHKRALLSKIPLKKYDSNFIRCRNKGGDVECLPKYDSM